MLPKDGTSESVGSWMGWRVSALQDLRQGSNPALQRMEKEAGPPSLAVLFKEKYNSLK